MYDDTPCTLADVSTHELQKYMCVGEIGSYGKADPVEVTAGSVDLRHRCQAGPGGFITGRVTRPDGSALEGACVTAKDADHPEWVLVHSSTRTDADGRYEMGPVSTSDYVVHVWDCDPTGRPLVEQYSGERRR